jgi:hypothetical protein
MLAEMSNNDPNDLGSPKPPILHVEDAQVLSQAGLTGVVSPASNPPRGIPVADGAKPGQRTWNTKNLGLRLAVDALSAACAAVLVAPVITMIDQ